MLLESTGARAGDARGERAKLGSAIEGAGRVTCRRITGADREVHGVGHERVQVGIVVVDVKNRTRAGDKKSRSQCKGKASEMR